LTSTYFEANYAIPKTKKTAKKPDFRRI